jgi:hypothetical protein
VYGLLGVSAFSGFAIVPGGGLPDQGFGRRYGSRDWQA